MEKQVFLPRRVSSENDSSRLLLQQKMAASGPKGNPKGASKGNRPGTGDETLGKVMESDFLDEISDGKSMI